MSNSTDVMPTTADAPSQDGYITMQALRDLVEATDDYDEDARVRITPDGLSIDIRR